ncbi:MAG: hypothetical protein WC205_10870 [Opitutaceae bacterium]|jgi:hypothetical protein
MKLRHCISLTLFSGVVGLNAATIYSTDYTDTNGTTPSGWSTVAGLTISSNNYVADGVNNLASYYDDGQGASGIAGLSAYTVGADFQTSSGSAGLNIGLTAFGSNPKISDGTLQNFYLGRIRSTATNTWTLEIYKFVNNTASLLATGSTTLTTLSVNTSYYLTFSVDAVADTQVFSVYSSVGGTLLSSVSATDASLSSGLAGVRMADGTGVVTYEDFSVSTAAIPEPSSVALLGGLSVLSLALVRHCGVFRV